MKGQFFFFISNPLWTVCPIVCDYYTAPVTCTSPLKFITLKLDYALFNYTIPWTCTWMSQQYQIATSV